MINLNSPDLLRELMQTLVLGSPVMLVYAVGAYLALTSFQLGRRSRVLLLCGIAISAFLMATGALVFQLVLAQVSQQGDGRSIQAALLGLGFIQNLLHAVGLGLIIAAVFANRTPLTHPPE